MSTALAALFLWPLICVVLFRTLSVQAALCISVVGGYLLLPSSMSYDLPLLPPLNKNNIPVLAAFAVMLFVVPRSTATPGGALPGWLPRTRMALVMFFIMFCGIVGMVMTNGEPQRYGPTVLKPVSAYDGLSMLMSLLMFVLPLLLGRKVLASQEGQRILLITLAVSGLIYCLPTLYEVRMSPQLHINLYGYYPHDFLQSLRGDGFRPNVFLNHGLELAMFLVAAILAAAGLYRAAGSEARLQIFVLVAFVLGVLVLSKSLGALAIALLVLPLALFATLRMQMIFAACIAATVLIFPVLRSTGVVPTNAVVAAAAMINPTRAESLDFRFEHEDKLLAKANQKPVFGWGGWGRNRLFNVYGRDISVTDGAWVTTLGIGGWARYLVIFGLLGWPIIALLFSRRENVDPICAAVALILAAKLLDLIPNSAVPPFIWLAAGSLLGRLEMTMADPEPKVSQSGHNRNWGRGTEEASPAAGKPQYARTFTTHVRPEVNLTRRPHNKVCRRGSPKLR